MNTQTHVNGREDMQTHCNKQELKFIVNNCTKYQKAERASCSLTHGELSVITCQQDRGLDSQGPVLQYPSRGRKAGPEVAARFNQESRSSGTFMVIGQM